MDSKNSLKILLVVAITGLLFSGYLSYYELFVPGGCAEAIISCGVKKVTIANLPACVYGFFMYLIIFILSLLGLKSKNKN